MTLTYRIMIGTAFLAAVYFAYIWLSSYIDTKAAPRRPMMWCGKHGALLEEYQIDFMGNKTCSICFHETMKNAESSR